MATLYKRGTAYYLNWREGGQQFRRSLGPVDRATAEKIRAEKAAELHGIIQPRTGATVGQLISDYLAWAETERPTSFAKLRSDLKPFAPLAHYGADALPPVLIQRAMAGRGSASASKSLRILRAAYRRGVKLGTASTNPAELIDLPRVVVSREPRGLNPGELAAICERRPLWQFMAFTGIRRGEMAKAQRSDIRSGLLHVESSEEGRTKSGKWRVIPLAPQALEVLPRLGAARLVEAHADTLSDWFRADADALGIDATLHSLRHTFCSMLAQAGVSAHEIKRLAGHSALSVTERYMHHAPGYGKGAIDTLSAWALAQKKHTTPLSP